MYSAAGDAGVSSRGLLQMKVCCVLVRTRSYALFYCAIVRCAFLAVAEHALAFHALKPNSSTACRGGMV
jgi:hypothetical protein